MTDFNNKICIITGGAIGIGCSFAESLCKAGAKIVIGDISEENGQKTVAALNEGKAEPVALFHRADVTDFGSLVGLFAAATSASFNPSKRVDIVISNAGVLDFTYAASANMSLEELYSKGAAAAPSMKCLDICLTGAVYTSWISMVHFRNQEPDNDGNRGRLIIAASEAGIVPMPGEVIYGTAKAGAVGLTRALGPLLQPEGIYVNSYCPNLIETAIAPSWLFDGARKTNTLVTKEFLVEKTLELFGDSKSKLAGQQLCFTAKEFGLRTQPKFFSNDARENAMVFFDQNVQDKATSVPEGIPVMPL